jgi:flagellar biosynthesis/type III secretory pathway M-ring protein FliF/YscJ
MNLGNDIHGRLNDIHANTAKAIDVATYIRLDLDKQIEALDSLEDENKEFAKRMKRAKKGLQVIIRRAMMNKCTQCLMVLMILAVIALIIVYAVKSQDNPQPQP